MKRLLVFLLLLGGCAPQIPYSHPVEKTESFIRGRYQLNYANDLYVVEIDGEQYIVIDGQVGVAICPK